MNKSDENDARILAIIPSNNLKELLMKYHKLKRRIVKIQRWDNEAPLDGNVQINMFSHLLLSSSDIVNMFRLLKQDNIQIFAYRNPTIV